MPSHSYCSLVSQYLIISIHLIIYSFNNQIYSAGVGLSSSGADGNLNASPVGSGADAVQLCNKGKELL